mgnify:CR=1 FL=1
MEVGANVKNLKVGDRVAMEPGKTCGQCEFCKSGKYNLCEDVVFFATPPVDGVFQEYVAHEAGLCFKLPDNVSTLEGALIEPLAVGMHAARQGEAKLGQTAVVTGAGCIGLVSLLSLKAMGVTKVIVVDVMENRLQKALELGADAVINGKTEDTVARIKELTDGKGFDLGIEPAGNQITDPRSEEGCHHRFCRIQCKRRDDVADRHVSGQGTDLQDGIPLPQHLPDRNRSGCTG